MRPEHNAESQMNHLLVVLGFVSTIELCITSANVEWYCAMDNCIKASNSQKITHNLPMKGVYCQYFEDNWSGNGLHCITHKPKGSFQHEQLGWVAKNRSGIGSSAVGDVPTVPWDPQAVIIHLVFLSDPLSSWSSINSFRPEYDGQNLGEDNLNCILLIENVVFSKKKYRWTLFLRFLQSILSQYWLRY